MNGRQLRVIACVVLVPALAGCATEESAPTRSVEEDELRMIRDIIFNGTRDGDNKPNDEQTNQEPEDWPRNPPPKVKRLLGIHRHKVSWSNVTGFPDNPVIGYHAKVCTNPNGTACGGELANSTKLFGEAPVSNGLRANWFEGVNVTGVAFERVPPEGRICLVIYVVGKYPPRHSEPHLPTCIGG